MCPRCGDAPLQPDRAADTNLTFAELSCRNGHHYPVRHGILHALSDLPAWIAGQREVAARERLGELTDDEASRYRTHISSIGAATYNELIRENAQGALEELSVKDGWSLDLGGGSGWLAAMLAERGFRAVSIDIEDPLERATQIERGANARTYELVTDVAAQIDQAQVDCVVGDFDRLPFATASFALVTTSAALHHARDPVATLREAARVLRPDGWLLCLNEQARGLLRDESWVMQGHPADAGEHIYWPREYLGFFRAAGLVPRLVFPGWIDRKLRNRDWTGVVYYPHLRSLAGALWQTPGIRRLVRGPLLRPVVDVFGLTVIVLARKSTRC